MRYVASTRERAEVGSEAMIVQATKGKPRSEHDRITTLLLDKYTKKIIALPPGTFSAKRWLTYYVRVVDREMSK